MTRAASPRPRLHLMQGLTVREVLTASTLSGARVLAGDAGLERIVQRLNVMEVPDILPWVKPREFLLTTAYPLRETPEGLWGLVGELDERGLAGLGVKVGRYLDAIPAAVLSRADELGFPLVQLPDNVGFDDILNQVLTDILNRQAASIAVSVEIHHALLQIVLSGGGLQEIGDDLAALLDCCILLTDGDGQVRASCGFGEVRPALTAAGVLRAGGDVLVHELGTGTLTIPDPPVRLMVVPVLAGRRNHGHIIAVQTRRRLHDEDLLALENAATVAALAITKQQAVTAVESKFASDFLHDLLGGKVASAAHAVTRGRALGWDLERPLVVMVAQLDATADAGANDSEADTRVAADAGPPADAEAEPPADAEAEPPADADADDSPMGRALERMAGGVAAAVRGRDARAAVVTLSDEVVVLTEAPEGGQPRAAAAEFATYVGAEARSAARSSVSVGVSRVVGGPLDVVHGYDQANRAARVGRQIFGRGAATHFDDLGAFRLLSLIPDSRELTAFASEILGGIAGDDPTSTDLRKTLQVLLDTNLNIAEAARRLHFHYNTLRYRVEKLQGLVGPFTTDPQLRLNLLLALQIASTPQFRGR